MPLNNFSTPTTCGKREKKAARLWIVMLNSALLGKSKGSAWPAPPRRQPRTGLRLIHFNHTGGQCGSHGSNLHLEQKYIYVYITYILM
jgi:hypothetical protein